MSTITNCLWFDGQAEEAANFYVAVFPDSAITGISRYPSAVGSNEIGDVLTVDFTLRGVEFLGLNGGPGFAFTEAVSFSIDCADQQEVDYFWNHLISQGGQEGQCGWLKDRFGVSWQVVPAILPQLMSGSDPEASARVMQAYMGMTKFDIAALEAARKG